MRPAALLPALILTAGCRQGTDATVKQARGVLRYELCFYIDTSTGGERCTVEFDDYKVPAYDTTKAEPFYEFCKQEFPEIEPRPNWVCYLRKPYKGHDFAWDLPPNQGFCYSLNRDLLMPYEPYAVALYRDMKRNGGEPWTHMRGALLNAFSGKGDNVAEALVGLVERWVALKEGKWRSWWGPQTGPDGAGFRLEDRCGILDRPRTLTIEWHDRLDDLYGITRLLPARAEPGDGR